jgi:hypothetical protein
MKKTKLLVGLSIVAVAGALLVSADHIDAPSTKGTTTDIADFYAFEPVEGSNNTVFQVDMQTTVLPDLAYGTFDENVLTVIKIDNDGDLVEDLVIQAIPRNGRMYFFGPAAPSATGLNNQVLVDSPLGDVAISTTTAITATSDNGTTLFAGPRQDPFFFDFTQFNKVIGGMAPEGFLPAGEAVNTFASANTMSIILEIPNSVLGATSATNALGIPVYKVWVTTNIKQ